MIPIANRSERERGLLGRHVRELSLHLAVTRVRQAILGLDHPEIGQARVAVGADQHVVRRHVAVHEVEPPAFVVAQVVRRREPGERVGHDAQHDRNRHAVAALVRARQERAQVIALDVLHHQEVAGVGRVADVDGGDDVRVADAGCQPRLVEEHADELFLVGEVRVQHLDRDQALEARGALRVGHVHHGHAARGELGQDFVAPEAESGRELSRAQRHALPQLHH
jgi:hypothetical protein